MNGVIALITDFGTSDGYAGTMHGVILDLNPAARIVDLSHDVAPQDVQQAAYILYAAYPYFPAGSVFVVVVDPGVGSERLAIAAEAAGAFFVAPDNGVLSYVLAGEPPKCVVQLGRAEFWLPEVSATFHGRDIFAPAAAQLSLGTPLDELGPPLDAIMELPVPRPTVSADGCCIEGHALHIDHFGNVITDVRRELLAPDLVWTVEVRGDPIGPIRRTYSAVEPGVPLALIGSRGHLEISVRNGRAADKLGLRVGDPVSIRRR